jgi:hypothetical protein
VKINGLGDWLGTKWLIFRVKIWGVKSLSEKERIMWVFVNPKAPWNKEHPND